jgi:DUF4097 and DUF4098 domain-containing protein YvlB
MGVMLAAAAGASAQDGQVQVQTPQVQAQIKDLQTRIETRIQERIRISQEVTERVHQLIQTTVGAQIARDLSRELGRTARDVARGVDSLHAIPGGLDQNRDYKFEQKDTQTKTLAIGATGSLTLKNVVGDITVKVGSGRDVTVEIVRISKGKTDADAKAGLEKVQAEVSVRGEHGSVTARYPSDMHPEYGVSVAYNVTAPAGTSVWAESIAGSVGVTGLQGEIKATTVSGKLDVMSCTKVSSLRTIAGAVTVTDSRSETKMDIGGVSANVRLTNVKAPQVSATVISGSIVAHDVQAEGADIGSMSGNIEYSGTVAAKGRYEFSAHSGNVRLALTGGFDLEGKTFSGKVEADASLNLTTTVPASSNDRQHSLRGTTGNGGAAVVATTFSGNVWVGRKLQ